MIPGPREQECEVIYSSMRSVPRGHSHQQSEPEDPVLLHIKAAGAAVLFLFIMIHVGDSEMLEGVPGLCYLVIFLILYHSFFRFQKLPKHHID
jgi:hypothetical protein